MNITENLNKQSNKNIIRIDIDEIGKYYQYKFMIKNECIYFKYYYKLNRISQIYYKNLEFLGIYKINKLNIIYKL